MSIWLESYLSALQVRDTHERATEHLINSYTSLADHTSTLQNSTPISEHPPTSQKQPPAIPPPILGGRRPNSPATTNTSSQTLRQDLAAAQRSRSTLTIELTTLRVQFSSLQAAADEAQKTINTLQAQKSALEGRLRDRVSELKEKGKMLERVQDEIVGLEMQVNVAEREKGRVLGENEELVKRLVGLKREVERRGGEGEEE